MTVTNKTTAYLVAILATIVVMCSCPVDCLACAATSILVHVCREYRDSFAGRHISADHLPRRLAATFRGPAFRYVHSFQYAYLRGRGLA